MVNNAALGQPEKQRGAWSGRLGFILAAVGSAVGLGNIVRFPFSVADNGGASFLVIYLVILFLIGLPVMFAELSLGRRGKLNPVGTFRKLSGGNRFWVGIGALFVLTSVFIISWYSVLAGVVLRAIWDSASGSYFADPAGYYASVREGPVTLMLHLVTMAAVTFVLMFGVSRGIERVAFIMMPLLLVLIVGLAIYVSTLDGVASGYSFYLKPSFDEIGAHTLMSAAGQAFFSLSLGQGAILTYASYLDEKESLSENGTIIGLADTGVAVLAGFLVFPAIAITGTLTEINPADALFVGLTSAFAQLGGTGQVLGAIFFVALFFAAFTSAVSLLEVSIAWITDQWDISRPKAGLLMGLVAYSAGIIGALSFDAWVLETGAITDSVVVFGGLIMSIFVGWFMMGAKDEIDRGGSFKMGTYAMVMLRYPIPIFLSVLLFFAIMGTPCALSGGGASPGVIGEISGWSPLGCPDPNA